MGEAGAEAPGGEGRLGIRSLLYRAGSGDCDHTCAREHASEKAALPEKIKRPAKQRPLELRRNQDAYLGLLVVVVLLAALLLEVFFDFLAAAL